MSHIRDEYIKELIKEVLGPRNGIHEQFSSDSFCPYTEYITGIIATEEYTDVVRSAETDMEITSVDTEEDSTSDEFYIGEYDFPQVVSPKNPPKSFGISFAVSSEAVIDICITWARYLWREEEKSWIRKPYSYILRNIKLADISKKEENGEITIYNDKDGKIVLYIKIISKNDKNLTAAVILANKLKYEKGKGGENTRNIARSCIYQPSIRVNVISGKLKTLEEEPDNEIFNFLYRDKKPKARGFLCSAIWKDVDYSPDIIETAVTWPDMEVNEECKEFEKPDVRSEFVPLFAVTNPDFKWEYSQSPCFDPKTLSETWDPEEIDKCLSPLTEMYEMWIQKNIEKSKALKENNESFSDILDNLIAHQKTALKRIKDGINLLKSDPYARLAFNFSNRVIWLQNEWQNKYQEKKLDFRWRPFQLAFLLMSLEPIYNENSEYRKYVDLLWIPTGGGKTEAYLAIMAYVIALRRLKNRGTHLGYGTAVITRYTLRLLTIQQFRRILKMITAAEFLRTEKTQKGYMGWRPDKCDLKEDLIYGPEPFSIGMWVGSGVSPNHLYGKNGALSILQGEKGIYSDDYNDPAQIVKCPVCGSWLRIPESGLPPGKDHKLHWRMKMENTNLDSENIKRQLKEKLENNLEIKNIHIDVKEDHAILTILLLSKKRHITQEDIERIWEILNRMGIESLSINVNYPGYFPIYHPERSDTPVDFRIYCTNPRCELNNHTNTSNVPLRPKFDDSNSLPIPAYTVDDQIYHRAPTVVISTVDKIARLSFEPRASAIFGNIEYYNPFIGYFRNKHEDLLPKYSPFYKTGIRNKKKTITQFPDDKTKRMKNGFLPPELIIQDELHLVTGPLGSMFGIFEAAAETIIRRCWETKFGKNTNTKYIASTATIKKADHQVASLFARYLFIFPPYGFSIDDSFFVRYPATMKEQWNPDNPGRVYMGIVAIGKGPHTSQIRIWSRLLYTGDNLRKRDASDDLKYYWTVVGYFNSIRELGGARSLYREDVVERLEKHLGSSRKLDPLKVYELSSRIKSTEIPLILEDMETDIHNPIENMKDAIFTTSMFGTGVDIPHLSLMIVDGQPKTTSAYIQATGRVGRKKCALVMTFYNAAKPRDLSHYEMFSSYHQRLHLGVEAPAVAPYSRGALDRAAGPALVSTIRNMCGVNGEWYDNEKAGIIKTYYTEIKKVAWHLAARLKDAVNLIKIDIRPQYLKTFMESKADRWRNIAQEIGKTQRFKFYEYAWKGELKYPHHIVLGDILHQENPDINVKVVYENAPQSLRDTEETTPFGV